ncbi:carbohydrate kinase family protein [Alcaligenaceae bacterium CGII-47]|nr:carbohydrate kinase family protein [Alcaligenaceae bacterium CGII-47]
MNLTEDNLSPDSTQAGLQLATIGAAIVDIIVARVRPMRGAKQDVEHIGLYLGGGAVNAALNFALLGARVTLHACVGRDMEGGLISEALCRHGVQCAIQLADEPTGKAVVMVDEQGEARAYAQRGASTRVGEMGFSGIEACDMVYTSGLSLASEAALVAALAAMSARRFRLVVNPGARQLAHPDGLLPLREQADLLCVNALEAQKLLGSDAPGISTHLSPEQAEFLARRLVCRDGQGILITLGAGGALFYDGHLVHYHQAQRVNVVSTVGAGDAFASAFAYGWASGEAPAVALAAAAQSAAQVIQVLPANLAGALR